MLDSLEYEKLATLAGSKFAVADAESLELELVEITARKTGGGQENFSLIFRGAPAPVLPQRIYRLENSALGASELFLVPISRDAQSTVYEAVFNRLLAPPQS